MLDKNTKCRRYQLDEPLLWKQCCAYSLKLLLRTLGKKYQEVVALWTNGQESPQGT